MDSTISFSIDSGLQSKSFFSSFSSQVPSKTWRPLLNSVQENQRLSRIIQVREGKLQELKPQLQNPNFSMNKSNSSIPELSEFENYEALDSVIRLSQKSLKLQSVKLGSLPRNLDKAMNAVLIDPASLSINEKLEFLVAIEILREKLIELSLDSEEILGYFKDILLESEASAFAMKGNKDHLMKYIDKRVEIFQSRDTSHTKIKEIYHLIMGVENWKNKNSGSFNASLYNNRDQRTSETTIKEMNLEILKKNEHIKKLKEGHRNKLEWVVQSVKTIGSDLKKLKHRTEFEIFNTWTCLVGEGASGEPSCTLVYKKIKDYQLRTTYKINSSKAKLLHLKNKFRVAKTEIQESLNNMMKSFKTNQDYIIKAVINTKKSLESYKRDFKVLENTTQVEIQRIRLYIQDFTTNKLSLSGKIHELKSKIDYEKGKNKDYKNFVFDQISVYHRDILKYKHLIKEKIEIFYVDINKLKNNHASLKLFFQNKTKEFCVFIKNTLPGLAFPKLKEFVMKLKNIKTDNTLVRQAIRIEINDFNQEFNSALSIIRKIVNKQEILAKQANDTKKWLNDGKKIILKQIEDLKVEINVLSKNKTVFCNQICKNKQDILENKKNLNDLASQTKTQVHALEYKYNTLLSTIPQLLKAVQNLKKSQTSLKENINKEIKTMRIELNSNADKFQNLYKTLVAKYSQYLKTKNKMISKLLISQTKSPTLKENLLILRQETTKCSQYIKNKNKTISKLLISQTKSPTLKESLIILRQETLNLQNQFLSELESFKFLSKNHGEKYDILEMHIFELEQTKKRLEDHNSYNENKLEAYIKANAALIYREKYTKRRNGTKVKVLQRKIRAFKSVLMKEKEVIKYLHKDIQDFISKNILIAFNGILDAHYKQIDELKQQCKAKEFENLSQLSSTAAQLQHFSSILKYYRFELQSFKSEIKSLTTSFSHSFLADFTTKITEKFSTHTKLVSDNGKLKSCIQNKCKSFLAQLKHNKQINDELKSIVNSYINSSISEKESIKIKLLPVTENLKIDIKLIKDTITDVQDSYASETAKLNAANSKILQDLEFRNSLMLPVNDFIAENLSNLDEFTDTCVKTHEITQKAIGENLEKIEEFYERIEYLQEEGYSLLNRYKQDNLFENMDSVSENAFDERSEVSVFSNPDEEENKMCIKNNLLMKKFFGKVKVTMRLCSLIKIIEEVLDKKFRNDMDLLQKNKDPVHMGEYLVTALKLKYNMTADKKIDQILYTFKNNISDPLIKFYCKMFQVFDPNPIPYKLSLYLIKMRYYFNVFVNKQVIPESSDKKTEKMQIIEILKTVRKLFNSDIPTGETVLRLMKPEELSNQVWTITCIQYYLYTKGMTPEKCYDSMTLEPFMTEDLFTEGLNKSHKTFISKSDLKDLFNENCGGTMTKQEFENLLDLKSYFERHQIYMVDQLQFLNALIEGYDCLRLRNHKELQSLIFDKIGSKEKLTKDQAILILNELDPSFKYDKFFDTDDITVRYFRKKVFELNIGGKGIGCFNLKSIEKIYDGKSTEEDERIY